MLTPTNILLSSGAQDRGARGASGVHAARRAHRPNPPRRPHGAHLIATAVLNKFFCPDDHANCPTCTRAHHVPCLNDRVDSVNLPSTEATCVQQPVIHADHLHNMEARLSLPSFTPCRPHRSTSRGRIILGRGTTWRSRSSCPATCPCASRTTSPWSCSTRLALARVSCADLCRA